MISKDVLDYVMQSIDEMDGVEFEHFIARLLKRNRFDQATLTPSSGDQGVDIVAEKDGIKYAIQCKCYSSDLGNKPVQEVNTGKLIYRCHVAAVITNRYFTQGARDAADATGVLLWDRDYLESLITENPRPSKAVHNEERPNDPNVGRDGRDEMLPVAVEVVLETGQASVSTLQRRLKLGYARAARIVDEMENCGIVGPFEGATPRKVLITKEQWEQMQTVIQSCGI